MANAGSLAQYDVLHFATHAFFEPKSGQLGTLILSKPQGEDETDGLITPSDVELGWHLDAELAVFSGCQTGPQIQGQDQTGGLLLSAVSAGARSVLASRWKVHDEATFLLMARFYENLTGRYDGVRLRYRATAMRKDEALQEARTWLRTYRTGAGHQPFAHPFYWSAFYLSGNPRGL
jgi:CHAT domain-containing protein